MTKNELIRQAAVRAHFTQDALKIALDAILDVIVDNVAAGERIMLTRFGVFYLDQRAPRLGRNPKTGEEVPIPARAQARFKPAPEFARIVKSMERTDR